MIFNCKMKKKLLLIAVVLLTIGHSADAQVRLGVKAGMNFSSINNIDLSALKATMDSRTGFQLGLALSAKIPILGIGVQPELLYSSRSTHIEPDFLRSDSNGIDQKVDVNMHYFEVPINFQIGLDLILLRPYLMISPFFGYTISNNIKLDGIKHDIDWDDLNRWSSGIGIGAGIDIWKLQLSAKYNWSFGNMVKDPESAKSAISEIFSGKGNFKGFEVALAVFF